MVVLAFWQYMKAYGIDCLLIAIMFCMVGYFNGCGKTTFVMIQGIVGAFGVRIPVSYIMCNLLYNFIKEVVKRRYSYRYNLSSTRAVKYLILII